MGAGSVGTAEDQAGVGRNAPLDELRPERLDIVEQIRTSERDGLIQNLDEREQAKRRASEGRRARGEADRRDDWLPNSVFTDHDNIVDQCCYRLSRLIEQPWRFMTIGRGDWANRL